MAGGSASAALPAWTSSRPEAPALRNNLPPEPTALGSASPPDPVLKSKEWKPVFFDSHQNETVVILSDLIIPDTDTPGAKAAEVNRFIDFLLAAESAETQKEYIEALSWLDGYCLSRNAGPFAALEAGTQAAVLTLLTHPQEAPELKRGAELFAVLKDSIVQAYYSSEIGMLQELNYQTNPFQPNLPGCTNHPDHPKP